jgi:chromosomal replication initiation ATPase DnaA
MKKGIFNMYVKLICDGLDLTEEELFSPSRKRELAKARQILYNLCYQRPMTINQIISLMDNKGYSTTYETVRNGINKVKNDITYGKDKDFQAFVSECLEKAEECC